ncbi:oligosaccharide flippase family protein [Marivita sp. S6314]|uniref:oligosaccharide flippase family protein n=1 Tax=Marivita sp. S6314 TaxID=2926406 RepID=UPI001FF29B2D|nr:oligosaccharide flippase family protein [Marivita sp. S6314]MCK0149482.1 oligosaccharide flippase family protein [Marivita sp. S6314]
MIAFARPSEFTAQLIAYAASEAAAKASRLLVVIAVARTMSPEAIGIAAAALASGDILKALTENGVGQKIISASDDALERTCATARRIFFAWCGGLFVLQCLIAAALAFFGNPMLGALLALLALEYLFMPAGLVQAALAMREGKLRQTAAIAGGQVVGANALTVVLALVWPSPLTLVLPRVLSAPIWLVLMRRLRPWTPVATAGHAPIRPFVTYGWAVLGTEMVKVLRLQSDKLIVGALLGAESLGIYFMAFNAGLGLATSFTQAFSVVLFPHLCASGNRDEAVRQSLGVSLLMLTPLVVAQAVLAPIYVPLLLGPEWTDVAHVVSILCLAALPTVIWSATAGWLRSEGRPQQELLVSAILAAALAINTTLLAPFGLTAIAIGYLCVSTLIMLSAALVMLPKSTVPQTVEL